jgi:hypothetical protein
MTFPYAAAYTVSDHEPKLGTNGSASGAASQRNSPEMRLTEPATMTTPNTYDNMA